MANFTRGFLSGTPASGRVIPVAAIVSPGTLLHTAVAGDVAFDELYLWAANVTAAVALLTLEWGGVLNPGDQFPRQIVIPPNSPPQLILDGLVLNGGLIVRAFADVANAINIGGFINRIQ